MGKFFVSLKLWLVKPTKVKFVPAEQAALQQQIANTLRSEVAAFAAVDKIYLMGSALRGDMGRYRAPFVNGANVKLGSDVIYWWRSIHRVRQIFQNIGN